MSPVSSPKKMRTEVYAMDVGSAANAASYAAVAAANAAPVAVSVPEDMRPVLDALQVAVGLETKYESGAQPQRAPAMAQTPVITSGMRDGAAHVLRCLKVWYDLPSDIFFNAVSIMDRFFVKMKVRSQT